MLKLTSLIVSHTVYLLKYRFLIITHLICQKCINLNNAYRSQASGDAPDKKKDEKKEDKQQDSSKNKSKNKLRIAELPTAEPEELPKTPSQIARE